LTFIQVTLFIQIRVTYMFVLSTLAYYPYMTYSSITCLFLCWRVR